MSDDFIIKNSGEVLDIAINHPGRGNGMSDPMIVELADLVEKEGDKARLIVIRGAGADFCVGRASMGAPRPAGLDALETRGISDHVFRCYGIFRACKAPILAVVRGAGGAAVFAAGTVAPEIPAARALRQVAGDRRHRANRGRAHLLACRCQERETVPDRGMRRDVVQPACAADSQRAVQRRRDTEQFGEVSYVNDTRGMCETLVDGDEKICSATDRHLTGLGESCQGRRQPGFTRVLERRHNLSRNT